MDSTIEEEKFLKRVWEHANTECSVFGRLKTIDRQNQSFKLSYSQAERLVDIVLTMTVSDFHQR